ncbi:hypothetical protein BU198_04690 [Streptomyces sp. CBMA156]|nr:hypothetical protein [Streptomyces sp. CBMA156]
MALRGEGGQAVDVGGQWCSAELVQLDPEALDDLGVEIIMVPAAPISAWVRCRLAIEALIPPPARRTFSDAREPHGFL